MSCKKCPKLPHSENITPLQQFSWTLWRTKSGDDMTGGGRRDGASSAGGGGGGVGRKTLGKKCPKYSRGPPTGPALLGPQLAVATRWSCNFSLQLLSTQLLCILQPNRARNFSLQPNFSLRHNFFAFCNLKELATSVPRSLYATQQSSHAALALLKNCKWKAKRI